MSYNGREKIYTNYREVNAGNIADILANAYTIHRSNVEQIEYLFKFNKGIQPILLREKTIRPEINNKIVINIANSITQFKSGYLLEKPIQYVARKDEVDNDSLVALNDYMEVEDKESKDKIIANHQAICGTAYRLVLPNKDYSLDGDESPFNIYTIDPRQAFVVYSSGLGNKPLMGVIILERKISSNEVQTILQCYTETEYFEFDYGNQVITYQETHTKGGVPLIEYPFNEERMGAFEIVIDLINAVNLVESNRVDGVEQFIQALLVFKNVDISKEDLTALIELGAIKINDNGELEANVNYLVQELNQDQVQTLIDDMLDLIYRIVGMPNRATTGTGDTGSAVIYRNGWEEAETRAQDTELIFKGSERQFLKFALSYTKTLTNGKNKLKLSDLEIKFTRRNYENTYQKAQILDLLLKNPKVAPRLAFITCGLFQDPESAYQESDNYYQEQLALAEAQKQEAQVDESQN